MHGGSVSPITIQQFIKSIQNSWFVCPFIFVSNVFKTPLKLPDGLEDTPMLRAILVFIKYNVVPFVGKCAKCKANATLRYRKDRGVYQWVCSKKGHNHLEQSVGGLGVLKTLLVSSWPTFLFTVAMLHMREPWEHIVRDASALFGTLSPNTLIKYRRVYQESLRLEIYMEGAPASIRHLHRTSLMEEHQA